MITTEDGDYGLTVYYNDNIGSCLLRKMDEPKAQVWSVRISPDHQNQGHAQQMMSEVLDYCKDEDKVTVWLQVYTDNPVALHVYQKLGFEITKTQPYNRSEVHHMEKTL